MNVKQFYQETNSNYESALTLLMNDAFIERMVKKFMDNNQQTKFVETFKTSLYNTNSKKNW